MTKQSRWIFAGLLLINANSQGKPEMIKNRKNCELSPVGTHQTPLLTAIINTHGPVLELGSGDFSTPLLHAICTPLKRYVLSVDNNKEWLRNFEDLESGLHHFEFAQTDNEWNQIGTNIRWSVVFIDHAPESRRVVDIMRLKNNTEIFVVHDSESLGYGYEPIFATFKYRYDYTRYSTMTTLVSDTINVAQLFND